MQKGVVGSLLPLFSCHNLLGSPALLQPETFGPPLEVLSHGGSEDLRISNLNSGTLCQVKSSSAFVFQFGKLGFGFVPKL